MARDASEITVGDVAGGKHNDVARDGGDCGADSVNARQPARIVAGW